MFFIDWDKGYRAKLCSPAEAADLVKDGDVVHFGTASSIPYKLAEALYARRDQLHDVTICSGLTSRKLPFFTEEAKDHFSTITFFAGVSERIGIQCGQTRFTSVHLSQIEIWCKETTRPNVAFLEVSPPDENGNMCYGAFGIAMHECVKECASTIVLQVNKNVPYIFGQNNLIHVSEATAIVEADDMLDSLGAASFDEVLENMSKYIIDHIPDGATIQLGLGGVSGAVGKGLRNKNDLGVYTEMLTDSMMELTKLGVVTNKAKTFYNGKTVSAFAFGSRELYDYIDKNPDMYFAPFSYVNDPVNISKNHNMISINTAMSIDLYGQVSADCLSGKQQSATGGQVDFVRGAQMAKGGKSFIALPSTLEKKDGSKSSRIVLSFPPSSAITTARADVQYVVTEYGCVNLKPLTMDDRARALISLAHPDFRDQLTEQAKAMRLI